jgi:hypothetical protein
MSPYTTCSLCTADTFGGCRIQYAGEAAAVATYKGAPLLYRSCLANNNCMHEVHVIGSFESSDLGSRTIAGNSNVHLMVNGTSSRRLVLVLSTFFPVRWTLHIPDGVVIDIVILVS